MATVAHNFKDRSLMAAGSRGRFPGPRRFCWGDQVKDLIGRAGNLADFEMLARNVHENFGGVR